MQTLAETSSRPRVGVRRSSPVAPRIDHRDESIAAAAALVTAVITDSAPTGTWLFDLLYRGLTVFAIVTASTRARRWTLLPLTGIAAATTAVLVAQILAAGAVVASAVYVGRPQRRRVVAAVIAALAAPALFLQGSDPLARLVNVPDPTGSSLALGAAAVAPLLWSAWNRRRRTQREQFRRIVRRALVAAGLSLVLAGVAMVVALPSGRSAMEASRAAADAAADGRIDEVDTSLSIASTEWRRTHRRLNGPWLLPARAIPLVGQHLLVVQTGVRHAAELTASAHPVVRSADSDTLLEAGRIDTEQLARLAPTTARLETATAAALDALTDTRSPWLLGPVGAALGQGIDGLEDLASATTTLAAGVELGNELFGDSNVSTIVVMFSTPAEARGSGGFVGNWAEFEARDGRLELVEQYRSKELNDALIAQSAPLSGDDDYLRRYERFRIERHIQDVTMSPHFPSVARTTADLYAQATGRAVDAVVMIDPFVLEALLAFSGPIDVDGFSLGAASASSELLRGQYERFEEDDEERTAVLDLVAAEVIDRLLDDPPDPIAFATELAPLAREQRIALWLANDQDALAERLGVSGAFPAAGADVLGIVHQNAAQNKIDTFLRRSIDVATTVDPAAGWIEHDVTIRLHNDAPSAGLPDSIIGSNDQGLPLGTNRMLLTVYSSAPMTNARLDGVPTSIETQPEFGRLANTALIALPASSATELTFRLSGPLDTNNGYDVHVPVQPAAARDEVRWTVTGVDTAAEPPAGWIATADGFELAESIDHPTVFTFEDVS